jgi:hypothetical protein
MTGRHDDKSPLPTPRTDREELLRFWRTLPPASNEVAAAEIIEQLERELADLLHDVTRLMDTSTTETNRAEKAEGELVAMRSAFEEECADADKILALFAGLGITRTEGGRIMVPKIVNAISDLSARCKNAEAAVSASAANEEVLATYSRDDGQREWWSGGTWLRRGDSVVVRSEHVAGGGKA